METRRQTLMRGKPQAQPDVLTVVNLNPMRSGGASVARHQAPRGRGLAQVISQSQRQGGPRLLCGGACNLLRLRRASSVSKPNLNRLPSKSTLLCFIRESPGNIGIFCHSLTARTNVKFFVDAVNICVYRAQSDA